jgi:RNA polymerase sigma-70 factor (ECF subfamily)
MGRARFLSISAVKTSPLRIEFNGKRRLYFGRSRVAFLAKASRSGGWPMSVSGEGRDHAQLLDDARGGSPEALGHALEACRRWLLLVAEKKLGPDVRAKAGASDLVQETFLEAQRDFGRFQGKSPGEFRVWLRRILLHNVGAFTRHYRDTAKRTVGREVGLQGAGTDGGPAQDLAASTATPSAKVAARERSQALRATLEELPEDYRRVIALRYDEGLTFDQIGAAMDRSPEAARKLWKRAIDCLRQEWRRAQGSQNP